MKYPGYGRFIIYKSSEEGYHKYDLVHSEITEFGHTVPYKKKEVTLKGKLLDLTVDPENKIIKPHAWLDEYVSNCMPYELDNFIDGYGYELKIGEFAEICGYLLVTDTSSDTPYGYEYDSELSIEEPSFEVFKLEDLKESYHYNAWTVAEWLEYRDGLGEDETIDDVYKRLVGEGYSKTWEDLEKDQDAMEEEFRKMMEPATVPLETLPKQSYLDEEEGDL